MKEEIDRLVEKSMMVYETENLIMEMDIMFVNVNFPVRFNKGIYNTSWVLIKRDLQFVEIIEGEEILAYVNFDIIDETVSNIFAKLLDLLKENNVPVRLKVLIDAKGSKFGMALIGLK